MIYRIIKSLYRSWEASWSSHSFQCAQVWVNLRLKCQVHFPCGYSNEKLTEMCSSECHMFGWNLCYEFWNEVERRWMCSSLSSRLDQLTPGLMTDKARVCLNFCLPWLLSSCLWAAKTRALSRFLLVPDEASWIFCCTAKYLLFWKSTCVCCSWPWGVVLLCSQWLRQDSLSSMC